MTERAPWPYPHVPEPEFARSLEYARIQIRAYCRRSGRALDPDLMLSEAYYRLARAALKYDPTTGPWGPYAMVTIRGAIAEERIKQTHPTGKRARHRGQRDVKICSLDEFVGEESEVLSDLMAADGPDPEACAVTTRAAAETWDLVRRACSSPQIRVLELLCIEGLRHSEIATRIGKSQTRVQQIVIGARTRLQPLRSAVEGATGHRT